MATAALADFAAAPNPITLSPITSGPAITAASFDLPDLSPAEWGALRVGLKDADNGVCVQRAPVTQPGWLERMGRSVFGGRPVPALANPRLDSLRRFVCTTRAGRDAGPALMAELTHFGFEPRHIATFLGLMA